MDLMLLYYNVWKIKSSKSVEGVGFIPAVDAVYSIRERQPPAESCFGFCTVSNFPPEPLY